MRRSTFNQIFSLVFFLCLLTGSFASAQDRIRVAEAEAKKSVLSKVDPSYPPMARQMKIAGRVEVDVEVDPTGRVEKVTVINGNLLLGGACVNAVKQWHFSPFSAGGKPASAVLRLGFDFTL